MNADIAAAIDACRVRTVATSPGIPAGGLVTRLDPMAYLRSAVPVGDGAIDVGELLGQRRLVRQHPPVVVAIVDDKVTIQPLGTVGLANRKDGVGSWQKT